MRRENESQREGERDGDTEEERGSGRGRERKREKERGGDTDSMVRRYGALGVTYMYMFPLFETECASACVYCLCVYDADCVCSWVCV